MSAVFKTTLGGFLAAAFLTLSATLAQAASPEIYQREGGLFSEGWTHAVGGYDTVSYHQDGGPVMGDDAFTTEYKGATWRFASQENLDLFLADPDKYRPAYGGYCAYAVSRGGLAEGDPEVWSLHEGTLYLNVSASVQRRWQRDVPGNIAKADANWPGVLD